MNIKLTVILVISSTLFFLFPIKIVACSPDCGDCKHPVGDDCVCNEVSRISGVETYYYAGETDSITAIVTPSSPGCTFSWYGAYIPGNGRTVSATFNVSGSGKRIRARTVCYGSSFKPSRSFNVVEVDYIDSDKSKACANEEIVFTANPCPTGGELKEEIWQEQYHEYGASWGDWTSTDGYVTINDSNNTATLKTSIAGYYRFRARNGNEPDSEDFWKRSTSAIIVEVNEIISDTGPIVCVGNDVSLTAKANPDTTYPSGQPTWSIYSSPGGADPCLYPDSGRTVSLSDLDVAGDYVVKAECGSSYDRITVTAVEVDEIEIYAEGGWNNVTDANIVVLKGTKYNFRAVPNPSDANWPDNTPVWSGAKSGTGGDINDVSFTSTGTTSLTATCGTSSKFVTIEVVEPAVYQVGFGGDHKLYKTPDSNDPNYWGGWGDGTDEITDPVYDSNAAKNDPVCVSMNSSSVSLTNVKLKVPQALTYSTTIKVDASGTKEWNDSNDVISGMTSGGASLSINGNIINQVATYAGSFQNQWKYKVPSPSGTDTYYTINTTSHTVYVTYGGPSPGDSDTTVQRIAWVCNAADDVNDIGIAANAIFNNLSGDFDLSGPTWGPSPIWRLHNSGEISQCPGLAKYVNKHFEMLGLGSGDYRYCHAKPDGTYVAASSDPGTPWRLIVPGVGHPDPTTHDDECRYERLAHIDGNGNGNAFEATCLFNSYYYALGVGIFNNAKDVVTTAFTTIEWQYRTGSDPGPYTFHECTEDPWTEAP